MSQVALEALSNTQMKQKWWSRPFQGIAAVNSPVWVFLINQSLTGLENVGAHNLVGKQSQFQIRLDCRPQFCREQMARKVIKKEKSVLGIFR